MAIREFQIISSDKLHLLSAVDWSLCYLCQKDEKFDLQFPQNKKGKWNSLKDPSDDIKELLLSFYDSLKQTMFSKILKHYDSTVAFYNYLHDHQP